MKTKILLFAAILLQTTFVFGQTCATFEELLALTKKAQTCDDFYGRSELGKRILQLQKEVPNICPIYAAEHNSELDKEMVRIQRQVKELGCTGNSTSNSNPQSLGANLSNTLGVFSNSSTSSAGQQIANSVNQISNLILAQADGNIQNDSRLQNMELSKLDIEPEFNAINSPEDYKNISLTSISYSNLNKQGIVNIKRHAGSIMQTADKIKDKVIEASKIEAAFLGANTIYVKALDIGRTSNGISNKFANVEIFGIAYTNKLLNFEKIDSIFKKSNIYQTSFCYKYTINETDYDKDKCNKKVEINAVNKNGTSIDINATIDGVKWTSFKLINYSNKDFTLMYFDKGKEKIYNYVVATQ